MTEMILRNKNAVINTDYQSLEEYKRQRDSLTKIDMIMKEISEIKTQISTILKSN